MKKKTFKRKTVSRKAVKKAVRAVAQQLIISNGSFYTAEYKRKSFSGEATDYDTTIGHIGLYNNNGVGLPCATDGGPGGYLFYVEIPLNDNNEAVFTGTGVSNFKIVVRNSKEWKKIANGKLSENIGGHEYTYSNGTFSFGCGAVEVNKKQIKELIEHHELLQGSKIGKLYQEVKKQAEESWVDMDTVIDDAKTLLALDLK